MRCLEVMKIFSVFSGKKKRNREREEKRGEMKRESLFLTTSFVSKLRMEEEKRKRAGQS